jgi:hypothetical protein
MTHLRELVDPKIRSIEAFPDVETGRSAPRGACSHENEKLASADCSGG